MLQPELKFRRDKIRSLMALQGIDAALITCNTNLIYTYGCVVSGYLYLPLHSPALLFFKRPNNITGEHSFPIRKPEQIVDLLKENGLPMPTKLMLEGDELPYTEYCRLASLFPETEVVNGTPLIRQARSVKTPVEIEMLRRSGIAHAKAYEQIPSVYRPGMTDIEFSIEIERLMRLQGCLAFSGCSDAAWKSSWAAYSRETTPDTLLHTTSHWADKVSTLPCREEPTRLR